MAIEIRGMAPLLHVFDMPASIVFYAACAAYMHLRAHGVAAKETKIAHYGMKQLYVIDPDRYNLCFQWPAK
jgi:hypothetical protein